MILYKAVVITIDEEVFLLKFPNFRGTQFPKTEIFIERVFHSDLERVKIRK